MGLTDAAASVRPESALQPCCSGQCDWVDAATDEPSFRALGQLETSLGPADAWQVPNPLLGGGPAWVLAYAFVLPACPGDLRHPVAMFATVKVKALGPRGTDGTLHEDHWTPWLDQLDNLYADRAIGRRASKTETTVEIGQWMLAQRIFEAHSSLRTKAGDKWANDVGGIIPPLSGSLDPGNIRSEGAAALDHLRNSYGAWWDGGRSPSDTPAAEA